MLDNSLSAPQRPCEAFHIDKGGGRGGLAPPLPKRLLRSRKEDNARSLRLHVRTKQNGRKKNEWILYAFIIEHHGGQLSLHRLAEEVGRWKKRDNRTQVIGARIKMNQSKGFERVGSNYPGGRYNPTYSFNGDLPEINRATLRDWLERLSP